MHSDIILIRGLFRGKYHWGNFPEQLQQTLPERQIVCVDLPGAGDLCHQSSPCSVTGMVESIRSQLSLKHTMDVIAISMGGMIGLKWAERYPQEVSHLVCINTTAKGFSPFYQRLLPANYLTILRALCSSPKRREALIYQMVSNQGPNPAIIEHWAGIAHQHPMTLLNFFRQLIAAVTFDVQPPQTQMLFISSLHDHLVSSHATQAIAKCWHEPLLMNLEDGHDIPLDNSDWLCQHITAWLNQHAKD